MVEGGVCAPRWALVVEAGVVLFVGCIGLTVVKITKAVKKRIKYAFYFCGNILLDKIMMPIQSCIVACIFVQSSTKK